MSEETKKKISIAKKGTPSWNKGGSAPWAVERMIKENPMKKPENIRRMIENNPMHHSGEVAYKRKDYKNVHAWVIRKFGNPKSCSDCGLEGGKVNGKWSVHWANISKKYLRVRSDWRGLCSPCHVVFDRQKV